MFFCACSVHLYCSLVVYSPCALCSGACIYSLNGTGQRSVLLQHTLRTYYARAIYIAVELFTSACSDRVHFTYTVFS